MEKPAAVRASTSCRFSVRLPRKAAAAVKIRIPVARKGRASTNSMNSSAPTPAPASAAMPPAPGPAAATKPRAKGAYPPGVWLAVSAAVRKNRIPQDSSRADCSRSKVI